MANVTGNTPQPGAPPCKFVGTGQGRNLTDSRQLANSELLSNSNINANDSMHTTTSTFQEC